MNNDTDPAIHWLTRRDYRRDEEYRPVSEARMISTEIRQTRERLAAEGAASGSVADEVPPVTQMRALAIASVLEECAARLRLMAEADNPLGSEAIADLAEELANDVYHRTILKD